MGINRTYSFTDWGCLFRKEKTGRKKANMLLRRQELKMVLLLIGVQGHHEVR